MKQALEASADALRTYGCTFILEPDLTAKAGHIKHNPSFTVSTAAAAAATGELGCHFCRCPSLSYLADTRGMGASYQRDGPGYQRDGTSYQRDGHQQLKGWDSGRRAT